MKRLGLIVSLFLLVLILPRDVEAAIIDPFCGTATTEINTAIGCIPIAFGPLFERFFSLGAGLGGGIAFLLILFGGFQVMTSAGNPEQLNAGRELIVSAISGLLMIIFSVFLLRLIGVNILGLPGFS